MQWVQDPSQSNVDNRNNVRREASRNFRNKKKAYLKTKIEELKTNSKITNVRDLYRRIDDFKKGYQPRNKIVKDEKMIWLQTPTVVRLGGGIISLSYCIYMGLVKLGRQKYTQQNHQCLCHVPLRLSWLLKSYNVTNHRLLIKSLLK